jgi:hypothetical protein
VVAVGEGDRPWRSAGAGLERYGCLRLNDFGDILGNGYYNGGLYSFVLAPAGANSWALASFSTAPLADPVPEPSTWAMMLLGFAGLGFARFYRARTGHATLAE